MVKRISLIVLSLVLLLGLGLAACAAPEPAPAPTPAPTPTPAPAESALDKIIEAAKKETGPVNYFGHDEWDGDLIAQGIKDKWGVDMQLNITAGSQTQALAKAAMEIKAGTTPSFDCMGVAAGNYFTVAKPEGVDDQTIDWKGLLASAEGADMDAYIDEAGYMTTWSYAQIMIYNSDKTDPATLPKTYLEVTDPKWQGKFGWIRYSSVNVENCFFLGLNEEESIKWIEEIVANKPVMGSYMDTKTRMLLGEVEWATIGSQQYNYIRIEAPDNPTRHAVFSDLLIVNEHPDIVIKGAKNKNKATLLTLFLATKEGRDAIAKAGYFSYRFEGTPEAEMVAEAKAKGAKVIVPARDPEYIKWTVTPEAADLTEKIGSALRGGAGGKK